MKKFITIVCTCAVLALSVTANAQDKKVRNYGAYATNGAASNWFVSLGGGIDWVGDGILNGESYGKVTPTFDVSFGKWVTPTVGGRLGYQGFKNSANDMKFWNNFLHLDVLWNISNQFWGYKVDRVYNAIPYLTTGVYMGGAVGNEFAIGAGLLNNFRINDRFAIFADLRSSFLRGEQVYGDGLASILDLSVGLTVNLGKKLTFDNAGEGDGGALAAAQEALKAAKEAADAAQKEAEAAKKDADKAQKDAAEANEAKKAAEDELAALKNKPQDIIEKVTEHIVAGPLTVYFEIGKSTLSPMEQQHLTCYFDNLLKGQEKNNIALNLTGSADNSTGSSEINERLCKARVAYVVDLLEKKYGISADQITIKDNVYSDDTEHPEFSRAVIIEH